MAKTKFRTKPAAWILVAALTLPGCATVPLRKSADPAEEAICRRVPSTQDGRDRVITLFYASSRRIREDGGKLSFDPEMGSGPTLGKLSCRINPSVTIGKVNPKALKKKGVVTVQNVRRLGESDFVTALSEAVQASPHKSLLVLVHGFKDGFEMTAVKLAYFTYLLDVNTPVLIFDWPGDQSVSPWGYRKAVKLAAASGPELGSVLAAVIREVKPEKLWVQSASLGCQVVCSAFEWMHQHPDLADPGAEIAHVAMSGPDVLKEEFNDRFKDEILALTDKLTVYVSSDDHALLVARVLGGGQKLGRQSVPVAEHEQYQETVELLYLKSLVPDKLSIIDVTPIDHASYHHGYDLEAPEFYDDLYMRIFGAPEHKNRRLYLVDAEDDTDYWIMRSDR